MGVELFTRPGTTPTPIRVGPVTFEGRVESREEGGQHAPTKRTEEGFKTTLVGREPVDITINAWVDNSTLSQLDQLRNKKEPFPASVGPFSIPKSALDNMKAVEVGGKKGAFDITLQLREVQQAATGTTTIRLVTAAGVQSSGPRAGGRSVPFGAGPTRGGGTTGGAPQMVPSGPSSTGTTPRDSAEFSPLASPED